MQWNYTRLCLTAWFSRPPRGQLHYLIMMRNDFWCHRLQQSSVAMFTKTDRQLVWVGGEAEVMVLGANIDRHTGVRQLFDSTHNTVSELKRAGVYTAWQNFVCIWSAILCCTPPTHALHHDCMCVYIYMDCTRRVDLKIEGRQLSRCLSPSQSKCIKGLCKPSFR